MAKRFFRVFFVFLILFLGAIFFLEPTLSKMVFKEDDTEDLHPNMNLTEEDLQDDIDEEEVKGEIVFLLLGIDESEAQQEELKKIDKKERYYTTGVRSDTMMIIKYNYETGMMNLVSVPRDTYSPMVMYNSREKINHAYSYGGPYHTLDTVNNLLDLDIQYYVTLDYKLVRDMVNAIGGVEIDVPINMRYIDPAAKPPLVIDLEAGLQTLDGDKTLQYLRFRNDSGDEGRIVRQQAFVKAFLNAAMSPKNILKLPSIIKSVFTNIDTNIPWLEVLKGIKSMTSFSTEKMQVDTLPGNGEYIDGISYWILYENDTESLISRIFYNYRKYD